MITVFAVVEIALRVQFVLLALALLFTVVTLGDPGRGE